MTTHSLSFDLYRGLCSRYKSRIGFLTRLLCLPESCLARSSFRGRTPSSTIWLGQKPNCAMFVYDQNCRSAAMTRMLSCPTAVKGKDLLLGCVYMSTQVSGGKRSTTNTRSNDSSSATDSDPVVRSRLGQTKDLIKETTEKMKEKMEEIITRENIMTIPNILCVTRIMLSPFLGYLVLQSSFDYALGVFIFAGLTDLLDGFIARNFKNQQSMLGSFLDPMADKFLVFFLVLSLTYRDLLPVPLTILIIARDACLLIAGFYIRFLSLPPPRTLARYFDATYATAQLSPTFISKVNTLVQLSLVACTLALPLCHLENHPSLQAFWYLTATTTVLSGLSYLFSKKTYQMLQPLKDKKVNK